MPPSWYAFLSTSWTQRCFRFSPYVRVHWAPWFYICIMLRILFLRFWSSVTTSLFFTVPPSHCHWVSSLRLHVADVIGSLQWIIYSAVHVIKIYLAALLKPFSAFSDMHGETRSFLAYFVNLSVISMSLCLIYSCSSFRFQFKPSMPLLRAGHFSYCWFLLCNGWTFLPLLSPNITMYICFWYNSCILHWMRCFKEEGIKSFQLTLNV